MRFFILLLTTLSPLLAYSQVKDLRPLHTEAKDQGASDTCAFYAITAALEFAINVQFGTTVDISEKYEWHRSKVIKQQRPEVEFGDTYLLAQNLTSDNYSFTENGAKFSFSGLIYKELTQLWVKTPWSQQIIEQLDKDRAVVTTLKLSVRSVNDRTGELNFDDQEEALCLKNPNSCGGHAIVITGYDRSRRAFTFKNSWGTKWGQQGFGTVSFEQIDKYSYDHLVLYFDKMLSPRISLP